MGAPVVDSILDLIGNTPLVRLTKLTKGFRSKVYAKLEFYNPGGSVKDRIGLRMVKDAEKRGLLKPGYTIVEPTSGNTGMGLALAAVLRGYKVIFTVPDKMSRDKIDLLKAVGAKVRVTPSKVDPDHPQGYVQVAKRIARETPHSFMPNQYENPSNPDAHYATTGPEIWEQTRGKVSVLVAGVGTGGTISGTARFLKEMNPSVRVVGADPVGSILTDTFRGRRGRAKAYKVEGIGEDFIPKTLDLSVIDEFVTVTDKQAFGTSRRLAREEGIVAGGSSGAAAFVGLKVAKKLGREDVCVIVFPDTGRNYLNKLFNDEWMEEEGYSPSRRERIPVASLQRIRNRRVVTPSDRIQVALSALRETGSSALPVEEDGVQVGSVRAEALIGSLIRGKGEGTVESIMEDPLPTLEEDGFVADPSTLLRQAGAFVVARGSKVVAVVTTADVIRYMGERR